MWKNQACSSVITLVNSSTSAGYDSYVDGSYGSIGSAVLAIGCHCNSSSIVKCTSMFWTLQNHKNMDRTFFWVFSIFCLGFGVTLEVEAWARVKVGPVWVAWDSLYTEFAFTVKAAQERLPVSFVTGSGNIAAGKLSSSLNSNSVSSLVSISFTIDKQN